MPTSLSYLEKLDARVQSAHTVVCVGLDPVPAKLPPGLGGGVDAVVPFCHAIIDATAAAAAAFKPNLAFFLTLGAAGLEILTQVLRAIPPDIPVILDAKLNDLGDTARAYSRWCFDVLGVDAVTAAPWMGEDAMMPYLERAGKGVIVLCKTSNPGSGDFLDLTLANGLTLSQQTAERARAWDAAHPAAVGLVVGATYPAELADIRARCSDQVILLPGLGAQGGDAEAAVRAGHGTAGGRLLCSASRSILYASAGADFADAAAREAIRLRDQINAIRSVHPQPSSTRDPRP